MILSCCKSICSGIPQKWIFIVMAFFSIWISSSIRTILSITITKMVPPPKEKLLELFPDDTCPGSELPIHENTTVNDDSVVYEWDEYTQGLILSSYFWGYAVAQFPCGYFSERFGGKHLLGLGILLPSLLTLTIPIAVDWGNYTALIIIRLAIGVLSGTVYAATSTMIAKWILPVERTKCGSMIYSSSILGSIFGTTVPAIIMTYTDMGWPGVYYFFGMIGVIWYPLWTVLCYNSPEEHAFISEAELSDLKNGLTKQGNEKLPPAPWKHILKSKAFWAFVLSLVGVDWAFYTLTNDLPKYMNDVVKFSVEDNGYLSSLPHLCMWLNAIFSTWLLNKIVEKKWMRRTAIKKIFVAITISGPACFILAASYAECNKAVVVVMFTIGETLMGCGFPTVAINNLDLSPNYAGSMMAVANGLAAAGGIFTPYIIGLLTPNLTISEWRIVFWALFGVSAFTTVFYLIFGSADVQKWDDPNFEANEKEKNTRDAEIRREQ